MKTSIALIGFMGTGKSAVGKILAEKLGKEFIELDSLVEQKAGKPIPRIFAQDGEIRFRELEIETVKDISGRKQAVLACGGGIVLNKINIDRLQQEYEIIYLVAEPEIILQRTSEDTGNSRPLLEVADRLSEISRLLKFREPFYEGAADVKIDTSRLNVGEVADEIIVRLREDGSSG
jgi:shikimate kinase